MHYDNDDFDYNVHCRPCLINLEWVRDLRGFGYLIASEISKPNKDKFETVYKVRMQELAT